MKKIVLILLIITGLAACYYDNEESLYPLLNNSCDTTGLTFSRKVLPVLRTYCYSCHSATDFAVSGGNVNLEDFNSLKQIALSGTLMGVLTHDPKFSPMPKGGNKLDTCSISKVKIWIDKGTLND
jgi:hypothetical protein